MPGFGASVRAALYAAVIPFVAAVVNRITDPLVDEINKADALAGSSPPKTATLVVEFVNAATGNFLLVMIISVCVYFLAKSYSNSEVNV